LHPAASGNSLVEASLVNQTVFRDAHARAKGGGEEGKIRIFPTVWFTRLSGGERGVETWSENNNYIDREVLQLFILSNKPIHNSNSTVIIVKKSLVANSPKSTVMMEKLSIVYS